jgi:hypothetical protein
VSLHHKITFFFFKLFRLGIKQGAWRSFLARRRKNVPAHFHRPPALVACFGRLLRWAYPGRGPLPEAPKSANPSQARMPCALCK